VSLTVTAALCWWRERPEDLEACVRGLGSVADRVVALDGAYARYPKATPRSTPEEVEAIRETAKAVNLECLVVQPDRLWAGQVEKRSHLLALASVGSKWIATVDADHVVRAQREEVRTFLRLHTGDVVSVPYVTPVNEARPMKQSAVGKWHVDQTSERMWVPHLWRALPGLRVEKFHWWYSAMKGPTRYWLWGGDGSYPSVSENRLKKHYEIEHRTMFRTAEQIKLSRAFLNDRQKVVDQTGQEDDRPELPRPSFDYSAVPW